MRIVMAMAILLSGLCSQAQVQTSRFSGEWDLSDDRYFRFENGRISFFVKDDKTKRFVTAKDYFEGGKPGYFSENSYVNKNNAVYSWTNSCKDCGWTETHIYHFSYVTDNIIHVNWNRVVNNIDAVSAPEDSWESDDSKSFTKSANFDLSPRSEWVKTAPKVGGTASKDITLEKISITSKSTVLSFKIKNTASQTMQYSLHPPGDAKAFYLTDQNGNRYQLKSQYGFGGFGTRSVSANGTLSFDCYFDRMPLTTSAITIKEGDCTEGCWNFYEVSLR